MNDRLLGVVILVILAVNDVRPTAVINESAIGADFDERRKLPAGHPDFIARQTYRLEPVECLGNLRQVLFVAGPPVEIQHQCTVAGSRIRDQCIRLIGARTDGCEVIERMLQAPTGLRGRLLRGREYTHCLVDRVQRTLVARRLQDHQQELDVLARNIVIKRDVAGVIGTPMQLWRIFDERKALWPATIVVLAVDDETNRLFQCSAESVVRSFQCHTQHELRRLSCAGIVERGIAIVMMKFLEPPTVLADGVVPTLCRFLTGKIVQVVPAAGRMLRSDQ